MASAFQRDAASGSGAARCPALRERVRVGPVGASASAPDDCRGTRAGPAAGWTLVGCAPVDSPVPEPFGVMKVGRIGPVRTPGSEWPAPVDGAAVTGAAGPAPLPSGWSCPE